MAARRSLFFYLAVVLVVVSVLVQETEARRKILRGRKALTRSHYRGTAIPAWAISVIVGVVMLIIGGIVYAVMRKVVLGGESDSARINYQPAMQNEP